MTDDDSCATSGYFSSLPLHQVCTSPSTSGYFSSLPLHMWLRRPLGCWERQILDWIPPADGRCTVNMVTNIAINNDHNIDVDMFKEAVLANVYNQPHLRADVDLNASPAKWMPATDFTQLFRFVDMRENVMEDAWDLVEKEGNSGWEFGSGKPLYRCVLVKLKDGYLVMNIYNHAAGDGTTGLLVMGGIMKQYKLLEEGKQVEKNPHAPKPSYEEIVENTMDGDGEEMVEKMLKEKVERWKQHSLYLPFDKGEMEENNKDNYPVNKTLYRDGKEEKYLAVRERCRREGVTVGSLAFAASYLAMAAVHAKATCNNLGQYNGMKDQYMDLPVNIRNRVDPAIGEEYCGFYVTCVTLKLDVTLKTTLWGLAREVGSQMRRIVEEKQHLLFAKAKERWENGGTEELRMSRNVEDVLDVSVSNIKEYMFPKDLGWGKVRAVYSTGGVWCPGISNYLLMLQSTDVFCYNMVYCPGENNANIAGDLLEVTADLMEGAGEADHSLEELLDKFQVAN